MNLENPNTTNRIALGAAKFGMNYGIYGSEKVSEQEVGKILNYAEEKKINTIDTAIGYGESEKVLGKMEISRWKIVTKIPAIPESKKDLAEWVIKSIHHSLERLKIPKIYGLLLHKSEDLLGSQGHQLYSALLKCKDMGLVQKIGISIYNPTNLEEILYKYPIDLIQAPLNVIDRRLITEISPTRGSWLDILDKSGVEIHVRSIFLQGLLLMKKNQRPKKFSRWSDSWTKWHKWLAQNNFSAIEACLKFALNYPKIDRVVVGVSSLKEMKQLFNLSKKDLVRVPIFDNSMDPDLINPFNWSKL